MAQKKPSNTTVATPCAWPTAMRADLAALYIGATAFHVEELMRKGVLPYLVHGDTRVVLREDLDKYLNSLPKMTGKLSGRGINLAQERERVA